MYSGNRLVELLEKQHQERAQRYPDKFQGLFKTGTFTLQWRAKVGSFPHPDAETLVSAGEPCGPWRLTIGRPEDKRNVSQNLEQLSVLPLNGYIPGSAIRGIVRAWTKQRPDIKPRMIELLGNQNQNDHITAGKIEFLDAWPEEPNPLTLDIVNPQENFQVFHKGQSTPLSLYTFGNGEDRIKITVAIRGIPEKATAAEVDEVWGWVEQALTLYGVGSRTASGYGVLKSKQTKPALDPNYDIKELNFGLYSQGSYGVKQPTKQDRKGTPELRPVHWRGWLRSWVLRFLLGIMTEADAQTTLGYLLGTIDQEGGNAQKGCVRLEMSKGKTWGKCSQQKPFFYTWKGQLKISAPKDILDEIILPIIRFAASVSGVGRGCRRPLHIFRNEKGFEAARGTYLDLLHGVDSPKGGSKPTISGYRLSLTEDWNALYLTWKAAVEKRWPGRVTLNYNNLEAEVFSPKTCAVYAVPEPYNEPLDFRELTWLETQPTNTRGKGVELIYKPNYKRRIEVGGNAGNGGSYCSWVTIKRVNVPNLEQNTDCQEIVCLFLGGQQPESNHLRSQFLRELVSIPGATHLFGVQPTL